MAVKFPSYVDAENSPGSQQLLWCCGKIVIQIQLAVKMPWRWKLNRTHTISLSLLLLLLLTVMGFISYSSPGVHKKRKGTWAIGPINWEVIQSALWEGDLPWEGYSQLCGTQCLGRRNWDVDSAPFPRKSGGDGTGSDNSRWITEEHRGRDIQREDSDQEGRGWALHSKAGRAQPEGPAEDYSTGRGRGRKGGAKLKHEMAGFTKWQQRQES